MHEVVTGTLWVGNARDARDPRGLHDAGIVAVVDLAHEEPPPQLGREFVHCRIPLIDGTGNDPDSLTLAIDTVAAIHGRSLPLLVACSAGASRSPAITAAALARVRGVPVNDALRLVRDRMPLDVSPALWEEIVRAVDPGSA